jgi:small conductance mechanosensitive channel
MLATVTAPVTEGPVIIVPNVDDVGDAVDVLRDSLSSIVDRALADLPVYAIALMVLVVGIVLAKFAVRALDHGMRRQGVEATLQTLARTLTRLLLLFLVTLLALSVAGVQVGAALGALGLLGLAFAFAFQNILENFIAGLLILLRKPLRIGDQVIVAGYEGTVTDVNMRVTNLTGYDGVKHLIPNAEVFKNALTNLTELGPRRSMIEIGVDYRDDADAVPALLEAAVRAVDGVRPERPVQVLCVGLGSSSVDFEVRYWTAPDMPTVVATRDRVLRASKRTVEAAGMTVPWPITTLEPGDALRLRMTARED